LGNCAFDMRALDFLRCQTNELFRILKTRTIRVWFSDFMYAELITSVLDHNSSTNVTEHEAGIALIFLFLGYSLCQLVDK
jgi:hypothetical protein